MQPTTTHRSVWTLALSLALFAPAIVFAGDWHQWRGPEQNGVSREKNLPETWDPDAGENLLWKNDVGGMSSPIVMKGKVYTLSRIGDVPSPDGDVIPGPETREALVCIDTETGKVLWQHAENMFQTDLPFHRLGWANPVGDPETNRVYAYGAQGMLYCLDAESGKEIWKRSMSEEFGMISTFGGRTPSPAIDEDQLFIGGVAFGWGDHARSQYRMFCFDKNTGELRWSNGTGGIPVDAPYNTPVIRVINGERLVVTGAGDGSVTAFQARTGKKAWSFPVSKRGLNASVLVEGNLVYACSSEENLEGRRMGTVICLDASSLEKGKPLPGAAGPPAPQPKVVWRRDGIEAGFASPTIFGDTLYVVDNAASVIALEAKTGKQIWRKKVGTIARPSLVYADGKLYVPEANGRMTILGQIGEEKPEQLSRVEVSEKKGREYATFGSVAIANGRVYLQTATSLYCIGSKDAKAESDPIPQPPQEEPVAQDAKPAQLQVLPYDAVVRQGQSQKFRARLFDEKGRPLGEAKDVQWSIGKLTFTQPPRALPQAPGGRDAPPGGQPAAAGTPSTPGENGAAGAQAAAAGDRAGTEGTRDEASEEKKEADEAAKAAQAAAAQALAGQPEKVEIGNLYGKLGADGTYISPTDAGALLGGAVVAKAEGLSGYSRVRVVPPFAWNIGFTQAATDRPPLTWIGAGGKFAVHALDANDQYKPAPPGAGPSEPGRAGEKGSLVKLTNIDLYARARTYFGTADMANYTVQADVKVDAKDAGGRQQIPDVGVINSRYALMLYGNYQRAELHSWQPSIPYVLHKPMALEWQPGKWYTLKLRVEHQGDTALVRGKVWARGEQEPGEWTLEMQDKLPNPSGSPGLFGNSLVSPFQSFIYYDNILVTDNTQGTANAQ